MFRTGIYVFFLYSGICTETKHGGFTRAENQKAYAAIKAFLVKHGLTAATSSN
jgi:hypothetical protein